MSLKPRSYHQGEFIKMVVETEHIFCWSRSATCQTLCCCIYAAISSYGLHVVIIDMWSWFIFCGAKKCLVYCFSLHYVNFFFNFLQSNWIRGTWHSLLSECTQIVKMLQNVSQVFIFWSQACWKSVNDNTLCPTHNVMLDLLWIYFIFFSVCEAQSLY